VPNPDVEEHSTSETSDPAERATPKRHRKLRKAGAVLGSWLLLAAAATFSILASNGTGSPPKPDLSQVAPAVRALAASLPWPAEGETALWAEDFGSLGICGKQTPVPIASVTKVMTAYVILQDHPLASPADQGPDVTIDAQADSESLSRDESSAPVRAGQQISERRLLELMLVPSAGNVARLLARWDAGTEAAFVARMNATAAQLGMRDTSYADAAGIDARTRSTASDQLKLAEAVLTDSTLLDLTGQRDTRVPDDTTNLPNTDSLLGTDGVVGGKTGSSTPAGGALMWAARRTIGGHEQLVLGVVLHQSSGTTPEQGLERALTVSRRLVAALG
jgi:D-alanyl-D-alanine carboxypeptidase (penicillin-binding protein 5/6)